MADGKKGKIPEQGDIFSASENAQDDESAEDSGLSENMIETDNGEKAGNDVSENIETSVESGKDSFEALLERLESIVEKMESGGLSLDESMELYEEGVKKAEKLTAMLNDARTRVMKLVEDGNGGPSFEKFDVEES